ASTGEWSRPDLERARELVDRSGTRGDEVVVSFNPYMPHAGKFARYVVDLLRTLGYQSVLRPKYPHGVYPLPSGLQAFVDDWGYDYLAAGNILQLLQCHNPGNKTHMCDQRVETAIGRATRAQISQPEQASEQWAQADHLVVRLSPHVDF